jgi:CRISPR-associated protein Csx14
MEPRPNITIPVDLTNPGQFFACCGLLELADRLWPGAEGWFDLDNFCIKCGFGLRDILACLALDPPRSLSAICNNLPVKPIISPLELTFDGDATPRFILNFWTKVVVKSGTVEASAAPPWNLWSGNQKPLPVWLKLRDELRILIAGDEASGIKPRSDTELLSLFRLTRPLTGRFGFDATAAWNAQDIGFSPNDQGMDVESSPATELLAAIGLQRFIPLIKDGVIHYQHWNLAVPVAVAAAFASGGIQHSGAVYQFETVDRGQYAAFGKAHPMKGK